MSTSLSTSPLTLASSKELSPDLLRNTIDDRVVRVRPSATPLDQISRYADTRKAPSMQVEFYSATVKASSAKTTVAVAANDRLSASTQLSISVDNPDIFSSTETVVLPAVKTAEGPLVGYIESIDAPVLKVIAACSGSSVAVPAIPVGTEVIRMGRAAGELDVQTPAHTVLPTKDFNLCQIFKTQVEEGFFHRLADKEVGWTFGDQEEMAVIDLRSCIERSYLFGRRKRLKRPSGEEILLTGGIWHQAGAQFDYTDFTPATLNSMLRRAFTHSGGSKRKILLAGSGLIEKLSNLDHVRVFSASDTVTHWGIDFRTIVSKFGTLFVVLAEVFDLCGMADSGMVIDPEYITKYVNVPLSAERISFRKQGLRNTEGVVLTEASCLVLRYPEAHLRITPASASASSSQPSGQTPVQTPAVGE